MKNDQARSIKRTLEVLEYFDAEHTAASVGEIARELGYPQSSTSILLKSLMTLGYLAYDEKNRTYRPTARVGLLGRGIRPLLSGDRDLMPALEELSQKTGELIFLATRAGFSVQYIHVIPATNPLRMHLRSGATRSLVGSPVGRLFLSLQKDPEIATVVARSNESAGETEKVDLEAAMKEIRRIRKDGYVLSTNTSTRGGGVLGMLLPHEIDGQQLAICIGGVGSVICDNAERFIQAMREAIRRHVDAPHSPAAGRPA